jgi:branched-chain amino acid transport system ATP-binding protein
LIPEGRGIFRSLSVRENLELQIPPWISKVDLSPALAAFPPLKPRLSQVAGSLSGGEQQMLALSRAYLSDPKLILLDEVSLGLAPIVVDQIFSSLAELAARSVALLIVEQYVNRVLELADTVYLLTRGEITWTGTASSVDRETVMVS